MNAKRVTFKEGNQKLFFSRILNGRSLRKFCRIHNLRYSTFKGYYKGSSTLPLTVFENLIEISEISPNDLDYEIIPKNWWQSAAGKRGIWGLFQKYDEKVLNEWRRRGGKNSALKNLASCLNNRKKINLVITIDENLAELTGAYLGDGTLTDYFIRISGDKRFDLPYFKYLAGLTEKTFGLKPKIRAEQFRNQLYLEIRSKLICDYFKNAFGFKVGDKIRNKTVIPEIILNNRKLFLACLRGLMDTDGSVSKDGGILSIRFTNYNMALIKQLKENPIINDIFTIKSSPKEVGTRSFRKIKEYFSHVGSSNLRHIIRYCEYSKGSLLKKEQVLNYYSNYENIVLPFKAQQPNFYQPILQ